VDQGWLQAERDITRRDRNLELISAPYIYTQKGRYTVAVKVIDILVTTPWCCCR
jgi:hypothetical protein